MVKRQKLSQSHRRPFRDTDTLSTLLLTPSVVPKSKYAIISFTTCRPQNTGLFKRHISGIDSMRE